MISTTLGAGIEFRPTLTLNVLDGQVILEMACPLTHMDQTQHQGCTTCQGKQTLLTEDGKRLLAFLRRHEKTEPAEKRPISKT